jgi:hypothetical protein
MDETDPNALQLHIPRTTDELGLPKYTDPEDVDTVRLIMYAQLQFYFQNFVGTSVREVRDTALICITEYLNKLMTNKTMVIP